MRALVSVVLVLTLVSCGAGAATSTPTPSNGIRVCSVSDVDMAFRGWNGATGSLEGEMGMVNVTATRCVLNGYPQKVELMDAGGQALPIDLDRWKTFAVPAPAVLEPGTGDLPSAGDPLRVGQGSFGMNWMNWCLKRVVDVRSIRVTLPDGSMRIVPVLTDHGTTPRCDETGRGTVLSIGPFQAIR